DHFQYLASCGPLALLAATAAQLAARSSRWRRGVQIASAGGLALLAATTYGQATSFHDAETLWRRTLARNPDAAMAHNNLGLLLLARQDWTGAIEQYQAALRSDPLLWEAEYNLGNALFRAGRDGESLPHYERAVAV